jgi:Flp pilus assembly secretin CpaC
MSKRTYTKKLITGLILFSTLFFVVEFCFAADTEYGRRVGRSDPFAVVEVATPVEVKPVEVIVPVKETGISPEQLQAAILAAMKAMPRPEPVRQAVVVQQEPVEIIPEIYIKSVMLKFLRAANMLPVVTKMLTKYGTASVDKDTNTLIICDSKENLVKIFTEIQNADQTPEQILIEVVIVDVQLSNDTELGINWNNLYTGSGSVGYAQALNGLETGGALTLINGRIQNTIIALQTQKDTEILASPRILVLSGQKASLETIQEIPYTELTSTGSGGGGENAIASTSFKKAGIVLEVKATVTDQGRILIEVEPDQSINLGIENAVLSNIPRVDRRIVKTTLLMDDGQVVVIGGLRSKDVRIEEDKIPLLGDIPLIGGLFKSNHEVEENSELLIFISPHICKDKNKLKTHEKALWNEAKALKPIRLNKKATTITAVNSIEQELMSSLEILKKQRNN